jgi:hypothetical protein
LPDDEALTPAMTVAYQAVGLTTAEIDILAKAQKKRDYYYRSVKGRRLFQLGLGPAALAFVGASSEDDQRFLDEMIRTRSVRDYARAMLERRGVAVPMSLGADTVETVFEGDGETDTVETLFEAELLLDDAVTPRVPLTEGPAR